jgi:threonine aldolase
LQHFVFIGGITKVSAQSTTDPERALQTPHHAASVVDLRSDTVTRPTPAMRRAMAEAEVGDDVYLEDPTVNALERRAAEIFGKEAALFVPSGCMGNLIAIKVWTHHGDEVICEERSHVNLYELASMSAIAGCMPRVARGADGILTWAQIESVIRPKIYYDSQTALVCLENSHNMAGGTLYTVAQIDDICSHAHAAGLKVHLDGARVFNAAVALGANVSEIARHLDSVMFCLSKGLGAPVGSMIVGSHSFIEKARIYRKMFGGGMRQVGILAAAGRIALEESPKRLAVDHRNAQLLAQGIAQIPRLRIDLKSVKTNIVIFDCQATGMDAVQFCDALKPHGIWALDTAPYSVRFVTHCDVDEQGCMRALEVVRAVASKSKGSAA